MKKRNGIASVIFCLAVAFMMLSITPNLVLATPSIQLTSHENGANLPVGSVRLSGSYTEVKDLQFIVNGTSVDLVTMDPQSASSGNWYYDFDTSKYDGELEIVLKGTGVNTRYSAWSEPLLVTVDNPSLHIPAVTILSPADDTQIDKKAKVMVSTTSKSSIESVYVRINGDQWRLMKEQNDRYSYQFDVPGGDHMYSIEAKAIDEYGNLGFSPTTYVRSGSGTVSTTSYEPQDRAMWMWEHASYNLLYNPGSRNVLKAFSEDTQTFGQDPITTLYLGVDRYFGVDMLEDEREKVRDLLEWAHNQGFKVHALIAGGTTPPHFGAFERYHKDAIREVETIINYNLSSDPIAQFDGINIDIEPYIAPQFKSEKPSLQLQYLDVLEKIMERKKVSGSSLYIGAAIPNWYDSSSNAESITWGPKLSEGQEETKWLSEHVQDLVDYISIMDYRDQAGGTNGIIERARGEVEYAASIGKPFSVVIGVETKDIADSGDPESITFREEGRTYMEDELDQVAAAYTSYSSYGGIALHHYDTIRDLPSSWGEEGIYWTPPLDATSPSVVSESPSAMSIDYQSIHLRFGRAYDNEEIDSYAIYRGEQPHFIPDGTTLVDTIRSLSYTDQGLLPETTYYYKVAAIDGNGNEGPVSSVASSTTSSTSLTPIIVKDAEITFQEGKARVLVSVADFETKVPVQAALSGRFEYMSGRVVSGETDVNGEIIFHTESSDAESGKIGFKLNNIVSDGSYWASSKDNVQALSTSWKINLMEASQDTHIRSDDYGNTNYGNEPILEVKGVEETISNYDREAFLHFSPFEYSVENGGNTTLMFFVDRDIRDPEVPFVPITFYGAGDLPFEEDQMTWNTQPPRESLSIIGEVTITGSGWYQLDLTDWLIQQGSLQSLTLRLVDESKSDRLVPIHSKENINAPTIEVTPF